MNIAQRMHRFEQYYDEGMIHTNYQKFGLKIGKNQCRAKNIFL